MNRNFGLLHNVLAGSRNWTPEGVDIIRLLKPTCFVSDTHRSVDGGKKRQQDQAIRCGGALARLPCQRHQLKSACSRQLQPQLRQCIPTISSRL